MNYNFAESTFRETVPPFVYRWHNTSQGLCKSRGGHHNFYDSYGNFSENRYGRYFLTSITKFFPDVYDKGNNNFLITHVAFFKKNAIYFPLFLFENYKYKFLVMYEKFTNECLSIDKNIPIYVRSLIDHTPRN